MTRIDQLPRTRDFTIAGIAGSGFASRVYRATDDLEQEVVLKVYRTEGARRIFGDLLHTTACGLPFPMRFLESAVLVSEGWHDVLQKATEIEGMKDIVLPQSHGHFFSPELGSFVGVYEWMNGESEKPPIIGTQGLVNYQKKKNVFKRFRNLAGMVGAGDRVRQWDWGTLVAPLNGLTVEAEQRKVAMIDTQPGLPLVGIPLSPADVVTVFKTLVNGRSVYFDRPDFPKLDRYIEDHPDAFADLSETVARLKEADRKYRDSLPFPLDGSWFRYFDSGRRKKMREATASALLADKSIDDKGAARIVKSDISAAWHLAIYNLPLVGSRIHRLMFHKGYQEHLWNILTTSGYRHEVNLESISRWLSQERITPGRAVKLEKSDLKVLLERPLSYLPQRAHRLLVDGDYCLEQLDLFKRSLVNRMSFISRFPFDKNLRRQWLTETIQQEEQAGNLTPQIVDRLYAQAGTDQADQLMKDVFITTVGFNIVSWPIALGLTQLGNEYLTITALAQQIPLIPKLFSITSILRSSYLAVRTIQDRLNGKKDEIHSIPKKIEAANLVLALTSPFGNAAAPLRMVAEMPELSGFLAGHFLGQAVHKIPVFGQKGTVTEALVYGLCYNSWVRRIMGP